MDPYIETPRVGVIKQLRESFWFASKHFLTLRFFIIAILILSIANETYRKFKETTDKSAHSSLFASFIDHICELGFYGIYAHTLISCYISIDKVYILYLILHGALPFFDIVPKFYLIKYNLVVKGYMNDVTWTYFVLAIFFGLCRIICYLYWNIPTRILYVSQFRKATKQSKAPKNEIFKRLLLPVIFLVFFSFLILIPDIISEINGKKMVWNTEWLRTGFSLLKFMFRWYYEIYVYFVLNPSKQNIIRYLFWENKTAVEKIYMGLIIFYLMFAITCFVFEFSKIKFGSIWSKCFLAFGHAVGFSMADALRYILLWYHAVKEWNVNDLSDNELEKDLHKKYGENTSTMAFFEKLPYATMI